MDHSENTLHYPESKYENLRKGMPEAQAEQGNDHKDL